MADSVLCFLSAALVMSVIALVPAAFNMLFRESLSAGTRYLMWVVVLIGFIAPFRPVVGDGLVSVPFSTPAPGSFESRPSRLSAKTAPDAELCSLVKAGRIDVPRLPFLLLLFCGLTWVSVSLAIFCYHICYPFNTITGLK
ncbi:MAG: hypothetical protein LBS00_09805 [Synergistaceae bacterium]|jgi:beta-lactamase regulating signal transducer with metallopeptidase domain|nr:hypothetical protein [Synergistaceae bacterium]